VLAGTDPDEVFANQFAANLLMPETEITERFGEYTGEYTEDTAILALARHFQVSAEAMSIRLKDLGLVS